MIRINRRHAKVAKVAKKQSFSFAKEMMLLIGVIADRAARHSFVSLGLCVAMFSGRQQHAHILKAI